MKKSYVYFIAPLVGVAIFAAVYWQYASTYDEKLATAEKMRQEAKTKKIQEENLQKKAAVEAALKAQEERKAAKAKKDAEEAKYREDHELAVQARSKAREDSRRFQDNVRRLKQEVEDTKQEIAKLNDEKKRALDEMDFQRKYVKQAQANTQNLTSVLERIEQANKAIEDARKAAAAEAAKKKNS